MRRALVCVLGPSAGAGKTVTATSLSVALAEFGKSVALVDLNLQFGSVGTMMGLTPEKTLFDLTRVDGVLTEKKLDGLLTEHSSGVKVLLAPTRPAAAVVSIDFLQEVYSTLGAMFDFVVVDTPSGFTPEVIATIVNATGVIMVGMLGALSLKNTKLGLETLDLMGFPADNVKLVLNRARSRVGVSDEEVMAIMGREPDVSIPDDPDIPRAVSEGKPILIAKPEAEASVAFRQLAARYLLGDSPERNVSLRGLPGGIGAPFEPPHLRPTGTSDPFSELKNQVHLLVIGDLGPQLFNVSMDPGSLRERVIADIRRHLTQETGLSRSERDQITMDLADDILGHGPIERLLTDDTVSEIMVNGPFDIWVERQGKLQRTNIRFQDESHLRRILNKIVAQVGRRVDESSAMVDARLPDGSRINAIIPPLSRAVQVTIRKFPRNRLGFQDMIRLGSLTTETIEFLERCVQARLNILISGGTGTGKTTLLNVLSEAIPDDERIIVIEDSAELSLHQQHTVWLESRPPNIEGEGEVTIRDLVRNSLRMRPDRIIVGEVRGAEAVDMLQAMNTGHDGSLSTVHANTPRDALSRLETMVMMAGFEVPLRAIRQQISAALDLIVQIERLDDGQRRVTSITEIQRMESEVITLQELFTYKVEQITAERVIVGSLVPTGLRPTFLNKFEKRGIDLPAGLLLDPIGQHFEASPEGPDDSPEPGGGAAVREPRSPIKPTLSGNVALDPEPDPGDIEAIGETPEERQNRRAS
jgi:Flp pilus assembly CpaF family ATPase/MinD-like ATPase involved in chromosome partitioning or flagellar assembly